MPESPTTIRLATDTKSAVKAFAASMGITFNAALSVLLSESLTARGLHPEQRNSQDAHPSPPMAEARSATGAYP